MSETQITQLVILVGFLVLVLGALRIRNLHFSFIVKSLLVTGTLGGLIYLFVVNKDRISDQLAVIGIGNGSNEGVQISKGGAIHIPMSSDGHFWASARINGVERRMLIDSGATVSAISVATANAASVDHARGSLVQVSTANGTIEARRARVAELAVGDLTTHDIQVYVSGSFEDIDVLGMNFLSRVKNWRVENNVLILQPQVGGDPDA